MPSWRLNAGHQRVIFRKAKMLDLPLGRHAQQNNYDLSAGRMLTGIFVEHLMKRASAFLDDVR